MLKSSWGVFSLILCAVFAVSLTASAADDGSEVFVVSSSFNGDANYLSLTDGDTLSSQEILQETVNIINNNTDSDGNPYLTDDIDFPYSNGNGLGDFDNDGDLDYIMAIGFWYGNIYISEKLDTGNQFAEPQLAANWGSVEGYYCMDFAVADYNEDGNADFILSLDFTTNSELYLGDGAFGFEYITLPESAASNSSGADAADFNKDGHADFVIAPASDEPFYVSLGHGDGTFTTFPFSSVDGGSISGVAAADFTGDGIADIAAVYIDKLYVYQGAILKNEWPNVGNQGTLDGAAFTCLGTYVPLPLNISGLDTLDFDGDGDQDLVAASYDTSGVTVFLSNGDGTFDLVDFVTYSGESDDVLNAVTAQPWKPEPVQNVAPVAVIQPDYIEGTVGEEIAFDGADSTDEDGQIVSYAWDFGDAVPSADAELFLMKSSEDAGPEGTGVNPSYTYQASGTYVVTLWVTDDKESTSSVHTKVVVAEPEPELELIPVKVKFSPHKLNLDGKKGKGKKARHLKAKIKFAEGLDARKVDPSSVCIVPDNGPEICGHVRNKRGFLDKLAYNHRKPQKSISVKFDRQKVIDAIGCPPAKETTLTVRGKILDSEQSFEGTGVIRLKMKKGGRCSAE
jgi:PKD repeat protein